MKTMTKETEVKEEPFTLQDMLMFSRPDNYTFKIIDKGIKIQMK